MSMDLSIVIVTHNHHDILRTCLRSVLVASEDIPGEIIVIDNASTDHTADVARQLDCTVVCELQKGYGQACLAGIGALNPQTEIVVFIDGDRSDHGEQLEQIVAPIINGPTGRRCRQTVIPRARSRIHSVRA